MDLRRAVALDIDGKARAIARVPLFADCPAKEIEQLASRAHLLTFGEGDVIIPEGEEGLGFYVILSGRVRVDRDGVTVDHLGAGDFFGEVALIEGGPRTATVTADTETTCLGIVRSLFKPMLVRNPRLALRILEQEAARAPQE